MDLFFLKIFLGFFKLLPLSGVNRAQMRIIASTKILMDRRRAPATWKQSQQKETSNGMLMAMFIYGIISLLIGLVIMNMPSDRIMLAMIILHSYLLFMMIMTLITDFSSVLLDTSDSQIILPKPVSSRTLLVARTLHIIVYMSQLVLAIMFFPIVFTFIKFGVIVGIGVVFTTLLTTAIGIFLTYILYGLVLRYTSEQKVKDIIGYFQIFMTVFFAVGYQILPRLINLDEGSFGFELSWYSYLLPPVWMAGLLEALHTGNFDAPHIGLMSCAVVVPLLSGLLVVKYLAPYFSRYMSAPAEGGSSQKIIVTKKTKLSLSEKLSSVVCRSTLQQAAFSQAWKITGRDKNFKMQFYPGLAYIPVFIFIIFFRNLKDISANLQALPNGDMYLWLAYISIFSVTLGLTLISYYENYTASWMYQSAPIEKPGELINGAIKALMVKFFIPVCIIFGTLTLSIWGFKTLDDILLAGANSILVFYLSAVLSTHYLPFSQKPNAKEQSGRFLIIIVRMIFIAALVGLHWLALKLSWLVLALIPVSVICCWYLSKKIENLRWKNIVI